MDKQQNSNTNKMIANALRELKLEHKTNLTFVISNFVPFSKPDIMFHVNHNPIEITHFLREHRIYLLNELNALSDDVTVNLDRIYKILNPNSNLIGRPFPESNFIRLRINLKGHTTVRPSYTPI